VRRQAAAAVPVLLLGLLLGGCGGGGEGLPVAGQGVVAAATAPAPAPVVRTTPISLRIPSIGVRAKVGRLGLQPDETVEVPAVPADAGWYRLGPAPGEAGSAVILGHVDSKTGPAVFYRLKELRAGDKIAVTMADGSVVRFVVDKVATYLNERFPAQRVYGAHGAGTLNLVTCGGAYDARIGYLSNVVVYSSLARSS
jgi:hypothetical protein